MRARALRILAHTWYVSDDRAKELASRMADNMKICSCAICTDYWPSHRSERLEYSAREQIACFMTFHEVEHLETP